MFSSSQYLKSSSSHHPNSAVELYWSNFCSQFSFQNILLAEVDLFQKEVRVVSGHKIPIEPFNGLSNVHLVELINDCFQKYPQPHFHAIPSHLGITPVLKRLTRSEKVLSRVCFIPINAYQRYYILLAIPNSTNSDKTITEAMISSLDALLCVINFIEVSDENINRLKTTELFVKEIGHDIASSVQAIIAKLRTIRDGRLQDQDAIKRKTTEIENEIKSAYGNAEMLGLAIDSNYQLRSLSDFEVCNCLNKAITQLQAEAHERNLNIQLEHPNSNVRLWGDEAAFLQCVAHVLHNAIKYSFGGTSVKVTIVNKSDTVAVQIANRGHELPKGEELKRIWDFGFRGKTAKELHVNGSGIGLFTVRKIVLAHRGRVWADGRDEHTTFYIEIPKTDKLKHELGILC